MLDDFSLRKMINQKLASGNYRISKHAIEQQAKRKIDLPDILNVLKYGVHEVEKTTLTSNQIWKYSILGRIEDSRRIRVIIAFDDDIIIITVIDVKK